MPNDITLNDASDWLRCTRRFRSTCPIDRSPILQEQIDQQAGLDAVAGEERQLLQHGPPPGLLAGQRLDQAGQLWVEQVEQRPGRQLGHAPAARRLEHAAWPTDRPLVEPFDELDALVLQQRADQPVDEARVDVADVGVDPGDDVALQDVQALPERLALAPVAAVLRQDVLVDVDRDAKLRGDLAGAVGGAAVDQHDLVKQRVALHQLVLDALDDRPDRLFLVEGRQAEADRDALPPLQPDQLVDVLELAAVVRVLGEPLVDDLRDVERRAATEAGGRTTAPTPRGWRCPAAAS